MRNEPAVGISDTALYLGHLRIRQTQLTHVLYIVKQGAGSSILFISGQLLDFAQCLCEEFCHEINMAH